ncbi:hypothetical protein [Dactylosporangium salmoneum]|uniref:hypothetical protein n=1 Tax=Dactylosporangium salmoneum TaxID=53361 RepID=UPI003CD09469
MRRGRPAWGRPVIGVLRPRRRTRVLGMELAGEIAAVGRGVTTLRSARARSARPGGCSPRPAATCRPPGCGTSCWPS